ncbi:MAG: PqiC family protein [Casimicrobiaceae bacterium]
MHRHIAFALACVVVALAAGCASSPSHFYTLSANATPGATHSKLAIAVGPVTVPASVDQPQIVLSTSANQVSFDEFNRWASPVQDNLARVVAENLVAILGTPRVTIYPQTLSSDVDYRVQIEVRNFESTLGKQAALDAVWSVRRMKGGKTDTGRTSVRESVPDASYDALAAAHSRAVARMSQEIAEMVLALERAAP